MPRKGRTDWTRAALRRLARDGIESVRVEPLAAEIGVTKGSFYWHFEDRDALLAAMLEQWRETATDAVIDRAEKAGADPRARLEQLMSIAQRGFDPELEFALRDWARRDPAVGAAVRAVDERRLSYLRRLLRESGLDGVDAEARAFLVYSALLGDQLLPERHGRFSRKRVLARALDLIATPPTSRPKRGRGSAAPRSRA